MGAEVLDPAAKRCTKCAAVKPLECFPGNQRRRDGRASQCRGCQNARKAARAAADRWEHGRVVPDAPTDPDSQRALRLLACLRWPELTKLGAFHQDRWGAVVWGMVCDPEHPEMRRAFMLAREGARR